MVEKRIKEKLFKSKSCKKIILYMLVTNVFSFIVISSMYYSTNSSTITLFANHSGGSSQPNSNENCHQDCHSGTERKNIFFLKTHKTASSSVQNILMRYGYRNALNFMLPKEHNYLGYLQPIGEEDLAENCTPLDGKFNIFTHHSRYRPQTNKFFYPDTVRVTILRDPPELFESIVNFYKLQYLYGGSVRQFIDSLPHSNTDKRLMSRKQKIHGRNQMSRDLGLEQTQYENHTAITTFIRFINEEFDLVMIREHFEASLVLLADLMKWPLSYVSFIPLNVRSNPNKEPLSKTDRFKLSQYNYADHLLYKFFLKKFRDRVQQYGFERLTRDLKKLHVLNARLKHRCVSEENAKGYGHTINYVLNRKDDWECTYSTKLELRFTKELREEQIVRLESIKKLSNLMKYEFEEI